MTANSVDMLVERFENPMILPINGKPTYVTIHAMHALLNSNAASVNTNFGCGTLIHFCLTLSPTVCVTLSATWVVPPRNPGVTHVIPLGATGLKSASILYTHNAARHAFKIFRNIYLALWKQLIGAIEDNLVWVNHRTHQRYSGSSTVDLLTHLYDTYTVISNTDWCANNKRFREVYTPHQPH